MTHIIIHKRDEQGREIIAYPAEVLLQESSRIVVEATFNMDSRDVGGLWIERGDRFVETFYMDRWYNVFAIFDGEGSHFKGWYANIARPAVLDGNDLYADDLALDMIVFPEGLQRVLDEDEFDALALNDKEREQALLALQELKRLAKHRQAPFTLLDGTAPSMRQQP